MAPVIWGLDLKEIQWRKCNGSYMFNRVYHLRREKMIVYQIAMVFCVISESVGTAALSAYTEQENAINKDLGSAGEYNNDLVGIMSYNIFVGVCIATVFGASFFFDLFWPERHESKAVRLSWKISAILVCVMAFADAIAMTFIVADRSASITGVPTLEADRLLQTHKPPVLVYRKNPYAVTSVIFLWIGLCGTIASTIILFRSHQHDDVHGPKAKHVFEKGGSGIDLEQEPQKHRHANSNTSDNIGKQPALPIAEQFDGTKRHDGFESVPVSSFFGSEI